MQSYELFAARGRFCGFSACWLGNRLLDYWLGFWVRLVRSTRSAVADAGTAINLTNCILVMMSLDLLGVVPNGINPAQDQNRAS